jgi:hypothetical protein
MESMVQEERWETSRFEAGSRILKFKDSGRLGNTSIRTHYVRVTRSRNLDSGSSDVYLTAKLPY